MAELEPVEEGVVPPPQESAPDAPQEAPAAAPSTDTPAQPEATPAPPEAQPEVLPLQEAPATGVALTGISLPADGVTREVTLEPATSNGAEAQVSVEIPAPDVAADVAKLQADVAGLQSRLEASEAEKQHLSEQLALHQAAANLSAIDVLKQIAALAKPFE